ncbi:MAG: site-2 protease family protein [Candidatus Hodarchaeaceae archaeon]|nr:site-2 protease family protein [Candidatus Hodarchaeaceae archaeon]
MLDEVLFAIALLLLFWDFIGLLNRWYGLEKHGFTIAPGLMMWRTKRGLNFIDRVAGVSKRGWRAYGTVAAAVGVSLMVFVFVMIILNLIFVLTHPAVRLPGVVLAYPGLIPGLTLVAWLVAIGSILLVHEFSHGVLLRAQELETKSVGGMVLVAIPGAFMEPNEKQLMRAPISKKLRMFAAGSMGNFVLAFICLGILLAFLVPRPGVYVYATYKNYPAENFALGSRIYQLDNVPINTLDDFYDFLENKQPGDNIWVVTEGETIHITLAENPENENRGSLGVWPISAPPRWNFANPLFAMGAAMGELLGRPVFHPYVYTPLVPWAVIDIIKWMFVLNLGVGLFNMLPAVPLDGGYMMQAVLERRVSKEKAKRVVRALSYVVLVLILMNLFLALPR